MSALKGLNFVTVPKHTASDPKLARRNKLITQLTQQRELARDEGFVVKRQKWVKQEDGSKQLVDAPKRVKRWWRDDGNGGIIMLIRYGNRLIELDKGRAGIAVGTRDKLVGVVDTIIAAVRAGELDEQLGAVREAGLKQLKRKAV